LLFFSLARFGYVMHDWLVGLQGQRFVDHEFHPEAKAKQQQTCHLLRIVGVAANAILYAKYMVRLKK
jgi:hypothetical protein